MTKKEKLINFYKEALEKNPEAALLIQHEYINLDYEMIECGNLIYCVEQLEVFISNKGLNDELKNNYFHGTKVTAILLINDVIEVEV